MSETKEVYQAAQPRPHIHARFRFDEEARVRCYVANRTGQGSWEPVEGLRVKMFPAPGEPFGSATPGGQLEMVIANPAAQEIFKSLPIGQEFDVFFSPVEKVERPVDVPTPA